MAAKNFTVSEAVKSGWNTALQNIGFLILILIIGMAIPGIPGTISTALAQDYPLISFPFSILSQVLGLFIQIGMIKIALKIHDGQMADFGDLFSSANLFWKFLLGSILYGMMVFAGTVLFIVPGVYLAVKYQFTAYLIVDRQIGALEALRRSGEITEGIKWDIFALDLAIFGINFLTVFTCFIGLLITIPLSLMAMAYVYRRIAALPEPAPTMTIPPPIG